MSFLTKYRSLKSRLAFIFLTVFICLFSGVFLWSQTNFTVGTYNLEKYEVEKSGEFTNKSKKIIESIRQMNVDVLGLVEMGSLMSSAYLLNELNQEGLDYAYYEWMRSNDGHLHLAVFSRYPLKNIVHHKKDKYRLDARSYTLKRGILEATVQVSDDYTFTVLLTHLKSQVESPHLDQREVRLEESKVLRNKVEQILSKDPAANLVVFGDLNDRYSSPPLRTILGTAAGKTKLLDARPIEPNGDSLPDERTRGKFRSIAWTHFYSKEDSYSRLDYILYSPSLRAQFQPEEAIVVRVPNWGVASDHRPIRAGFTVPAAKAQPKSVLKLKPEPKPALR